MKLESRPAAAVHAGAAVDVDDEEMLVETGGQPPPLIGDAMQVLHARLDSEKPTRDGVRMDPSSCFFGPQASSSWLAMMLFS